MHQSCPLVSIIIPTYNREKFIGEAIQSVLNQTYKNFEVIVIDDGSQDRTREVVLSFRDERVSYSHTTNQGRSIARNLALKHAKGTYIAFLDSDDLYYKDKIEKQVEFLEKNKQFGMVYTAAHCIDEAGNLLNFSYKAIDTGWIYWKIAYFADTTITLPTVMVRQEVFSVVGGFDENMHRFEDTDMWRRISKTYMIGAMQDVTCLLRTHNDNRLENQQPEIIIDNLKYYINKILSEDEVYSDFHKKGISNLLKYYKDAFLTVAEFKENRNKIEELGEYTNKIIEKELIPRRNQGYVFTSPAQLQVSQDLFQQIQSQLHYTHVQLRETQVEVGDILSQLQETQIQLKNTQLQLSKYQNHFLIKFLRNTKKIYTRIGR
ncbi:MAG: hypothetical protein BGO67_01950 [Alphaproteobacteria bacterium 41-28]|nr:MAG: hypothetical protein BGO67_01950 [Alphaproteobacteria bacterium 41-28]